MRPRPHFALLLVSCALVSAAASAQAPVERGILSYADQIAPVLPSVVKVIAKLEPEPSRLPKEQADQMRRLFGSQSTRISEATGFVVDGTAGLIVTTDFLLDGAPTIAVQLNDGREVSATVVGQDALSNLALLRIDVTRLSALRWGDAHAARIGDVVFAIGHARPVGRMVNSGMISGFTRDSADLAYQDVIVSDVVFAPGFAGGPLLDSQGRVLGIAVGVCSQRTFIPVNCALTAGEAQRVINELRTSGQVKRINLGMNFADKVNDEGEIVIASVTPDSPAARAGLRKGDVVLEADGRTVDFAADMAVLIGQLNRGRAVQVLYRRGDTEQIATVVPDQTR